MASQALVQLAVVEEEVVAVLVMQAIIFLLIIKMELINFIFRLGVVFAIFGFIWGIIQIGYNLLRAGSKKSIGEDYLIKTVKYFFLVDVTEQKL